MTILTSDHKKAGHYLVSEEIYRSREQVMLSASGVVKSGTVLGRRASTAVEVAVAVGANNTGNGVLTPANPAYAAGVVDGRYTVTITEAAANGGKFTVEGPDGATVGTGVVGTPFTTKVKFTLADGTTDFAVGDQFFLDVEVTAGTYGPFDPTATNGLQKAVGILWEQRDATDGDVRCVITAREAEVQASELIWPAGITAAKKQSAIDELAARHIILR